MTGINEVENYFRNYECSLDIAEASKFFCARYTSVDVWGNEVIWVDLSNLENVIQKTYKLKKYQIDIEIDKNQIDMDAIKEQVIDGIKTASLEMFSGITDRSKLFTLTCYQLAEWHCLKDEKGSIFFEVYKNGKEFYMVHLVKYAVVLDVDGNPIDPDIKEVGSKTQGVNYE